MFTCPICGKRFYIMELTRRIEGTACSRECRVIKVRERNAAMPLLKVCQGCGNEFTPELRGAVCCSMECARRVVLAEES